MKIIFSEIDIDDGISRYLVLFYFLIIKSYRIQKNIKVYNITVKSCITRQKRVFDQNSNSALE